MNENQRIENFNLIKEQLESQGYCGEKCTISILKANIMAFVTAGPVAAICYMLFFFTKIGVKLDFSTLNTLSFYVVMFGSIFVHEVIHGLTWGFYCKNRFKSVHLGVFNIIAAGGDTTIALMLLKYKKAMIVDHPTECGFWAFSKR